MSDTDDLKELINLMSLVVEGPKCAVYALSLQTSEGLLTVLTRHPLDSHE
jgi:hypothetical protein